MNTVATLFSGGGGYDIGAMAADYVPIWGIEYIPEIAAVYRRNIGDHIIVESLLNVDGSTLARPTLLHASPPCPNFSNAKAGGEETSDDIALAQKVAEFVTVLRPKFFTLENVYQYRNSQSWQVIARALYDNGYSFDYWHVNAADYGVPQTRQRMIVIARRDGRKAMLPRGTHEEEPQPSLFGTSPGWVSWYDSTADLLATLPDDRFAPWQLDKLPNCAESILVHGTNANGLTTNNIFEPAAVVVASIGSKAAPPRAFIAAQGKFGDHLPTYDQCSPMGTVTANSNQVGLKAFIMDAANPHSNGQTKYRWESEPVKTVTANDKVQRAAIFINGANASTSEFMQSDRPAPTMTANIGEKGTYARAFTGGRVVRMTPRCMARWQTFPDWYEFPTASELQIKRKLERLTIYGQRVSSFDGWLGEYLLTNDALACRIIGNAVPSLLAQRIVESLCPSN